MPSRWAAAVTTRAFSSCFQGSLAFIRASLPKYPRLHICFVASAHSGSHRFHTSKASFNSQAKRRDATGIALARRLQNSIALSREFTLPKQPFDRLAPSLLPPCRFSAPPTANSCGILAGLCEFEPGIGGAVFKCFGRRLSCVYVVIAWNH